MPFIESGKRVLFIGDSITNNASYVNFFEYYLKQQRIDLDIISIGVGGETIAGLTEPNEEYYLRHCIHERIDRALYLIKPDVIFICYGMNDGLYKPFDEQRFNAYKEGCLVLLEKAKKINAHAQFISPPPFIANELLHHLYDKESPFGPTNPYLDYDKILTKYSHWLTNSESLPTWDLHSYINDYLSGPTLTKLRWSDDGIHPNKLGHLIMARFLLQQLDYQVSDIEIFSELGYVLNDEKFDQIVAKQQLKSENWLNHVGYRKLELAPIQENY